MITGSSDVLPLEGHIDVCAICTVPIEEYGLGMVGLNAVLCEHCVANLGLYTPGWWCLVRGGTNYLNVWQYGCSPESPYWESEMSPTFLDHPTLDTTDSALVREFYAGLEGDIQTILDQLVVDSIPDALEAVTGDVIPTSAIMDVHVGRRDPDKDNPYVTAQSYLPRPYLVSGGGVYADFSDATVDAATIERILSGKETETESQSALSSFDAPPADAIDHGQWPYTSEKSSETSSEETEPSGQTALTGFTSSNWSSHIPCVSPRLRQAARCDRIMSTSPPTNILCHWSTMVDSTTNVAMDSNDQSHRVVIREWPDRPQVDVVHEQRVRASDDWQTAELEEVHPLVHRGTTTLCTWTETRYDRGIAMASHRNDTEHRVVIHPVEAGDGFEVVHERRGPNEDAWSTVDDHHTNA